MVTERHNRTVQRLQWLVNVRWVFAVSLILLPAIFKTLKIFSLRLAPFCVISSAVLVFNLVSWFHTRKVKQTRGAIIDAPGVVTFLNVQIIFDFLALSASTFFSGGLLSLAIFFFIFHIPTACILLSPGAGYGYSSVALLIAALLGMLQYYGLVPAVGLSSFAGNSTNSVLLVIVWSTLAVTLYLTTYVINNFFKMSLEEHRAFNELTTLFEIGKTISSSLDLDNTLQMVLNSAISVTGTDAGSIALLDEGNNELAIMAAIGFSEDFMHTHRWKVRPEGMTAKILSQTQPFILNDALNEPTFNNPVALREGIGSLIAVPLFSGNQTIGILYVDAYEPREFNTSELRLVSILANQAAIAINNAQMHEKAKWLAITDGLTHVYNHRFFQEQLANEIRRADRYNHSLAVVMMDIDHFKCYNDRFGHKKGDQILRMIAKLVTQHTRKSDLVARYGGDEFVIILPEATRERTLDLAERIRITIERHVFTRKQGTEIESLTVSLGVASFPEDAKTASELIDKVDQALYMAKKAGRNKVCFTGRSGTGLSWVPSGSQSSG